MPAFYADYEVMACGRTFRWGHVTHTQPAAGEAGFDAEALVRDLRAMAAERHGVDATDIRIRQISRLA